MVIRWADGLGLYVFSEHGICVSAEHQWPGAHTAQAVAPEAEAHPGIFQYAERMRSLLRDTRIEQELGLLPQGRPAPASAAAMRSLSIRRNMARSTLAFRRLRNPFPRHGIGAAIKGPAAGHVLLQPGLVVEAKAQKGVKRNVFDKEVYEHCTCRPATNAYAGSSHRIDCTLSPTLSERLLESLRKGTVWGQESETADVPTKNRKIANHEKCVELLQL